MGALYTWKDVERKLKSFIGENDVPYVRDIDVYTKEAIITTNSIENIQKIKEMFRDIFGKKYDMQQDRLYLDKFDVFLEINIEVEVGIRKRRKVLPLFKEIIYRDRSYDDEILNDTKLRECPVIAFHSYKGGVGRTLSLLAFIKAWSCNRWKDRLLIIDSDIEAPGLTWLLKDEGAGSERFCYFDLLELIQSDQLKSQKIMDKAVELMQTSTMSVDTGKVIVKHFFLPTYRYEQQLLDIYSNPESIARGYGRRYLLAEKLSEIGKKMGASMVLVDLRAGISEFSAPLIFDPRVKKYIVTSTSFQSVQGTKMLLRQICKGLPVSADGIIPEILLTMIPEGLDTTNIKSELIEEYDVAEKDSSFTDNLLTELPFAGELVHLSSFSHIMEKLEGQSFYKGVCDFVIDRYKEQQFLVKGNNLRDSRDDVITRIHQLAEAQITAEGSDESAVLQTRSISNLIRRYADDVPQAVILGAKGSGKTFLFREMIRKVKWEDFVDSFEDGHSGDSETFILPLLTSGNIDDSLVRIIKNSLLEFSQNISVALSGSDYWHDNIAKILKYKKNEHDGLDWGDFWKECILSAFQTDISLEQLDDILQREKRRIMFLVDGLEEIFENTMESQNEKNAVKILAKDLLSEFKIKYKNIGLLVFLRKDLANNALVNNYAQFENQYRTIALNWSHEEALRLALWLVSKAVPDFCDGIDPERASRDVVDEYLNKLWGVKLGKRSSNEAYSSRWILAALSDFNSQLQARDIIRFLKYATRGAGIQPKYYDRYIMPGEIRNAVQECSKLKIQEIKEEIVGLRSILENLENAPEEKRVLPFKSDTFNWSIDQEKMLKQEGLLIIDNDKYYLPEIIRHALRFKYEKGARPKVLSLLLKK